MKELYHTQGKTHQGEWIEIGPSFDYEFQAQSWLKAFKAYHKGEYQRYRIICWRME